MKDVHVGGMYNDSEKQVSRSFRISVLFRSNCGFAGVEIANPTPASLITA